MKSNIKTMKFELKPMTLAELKISDLRLIIKEDNLTGNERLEIEKLIKKIGRKRSRGIENLTK